MLWRPGITGLLQWQPWSSCGRLPSCRLSHSKHDPRLHGNSSGQVHMHVYHLGARHVPWLSRSHAPRLTLPFNRASLAYTCRRRCATIIGHNATRFVHIFTLTGHHAAIWHRSCLFACSTACLASVSCKRNTHQDILQSKWHRLPLPEPSLVRSPELMHASAHKPLCCVWGP